MKTDYIYIYICIMALIIKGTIANGSLLYNILLTSSSLAASEKCLALSNIGWAKKKCQWICRRKGSLKKKQKNKKKKTKNEKQKKIVDGY
jgi:hypothetical protein